MNKIYIYFDSVNVTGGTPDENEYIQHVFMSQADTFSVKQAKDAYYSIITPGKLKNLVPKAIYDNQDGLFTLDMEASVKDNYRLAFGGYISSSPPHSGGRKSTWLTWSSFSGGHSSLCRDKVTDGVTSQKPPEPRIQGRVGSGKADPVPSYPSPLPGMNQCPPCAV